MCYIGGMEGDKRIRKTKKSIREAFFSLLERKDLEDITITELSDLADINRKTFYNHYDNLDMLVDELNAEVVAEYEKSMEGFEQGSSFDNPLDLFRRLNIFFGGDNLYSKLLKSNRNWDLTRRLTISIGEKALKTTPRTDKKLSLVLELYIPGILMIYRHWLMEGKKEDLEKLAEALSVTIFQGLNTFLDYAPERL